MTRSRSQGMSPHVQRALTDKSVVQGVTCTCGTPLIFDTDAIGRVIERCPICRHAKLFQGPPMRTRAHHEEEQGVTIDGQPRRGPRKGKA